MEEIKRIGRTHGFQTPFFRKRLWPILLNVDSQNSELSGKFLIFWIKKKMAEWMKWWSKMILNLEAINLKNKLTKMWIDLCYVLRTSRTAQNKICKKIHPSLWVSPFNNVCIIFRKYNRRMLRRILNQIFSKHPEMDYYQGYHDVCSIFLIIFGFDAGKLAEQAALSFFRYALFLLFFKLSFFPQG